MMYVVLIWDRFPTWPSGTVGSVVDDLAEATERAEKETAKARSRGSSARFTVHTLSWPPLYDSAD